MSNYVASVGMEVHAELSTASKMFCRCAVSFGGEPNTRVCPVCLGLPGSLPVPNREAIKMVQRASIALNCTLARNSVFHRKNYFYPDLPKGYQVSQYGETNPLGYHGYLELPSGNRVRIRRVHLEEDTGKLMHLPAGGSGVDYNRAGVPLMEVVTDFPPDIESADDAKEYISRLRQLLVWIGVCNGKLEEGSLRCEPNISIRLAGASEYGVKSELKNLGSFRSVQLGVQFEVERQTEALLAGTSLKQETRGWNEATEESFPMRVKEMENDYRYFADPDLSQMSFSEGELEALRKTIPELPIEKARRFRTTFGLSDYDSEIMTSDTAWASFFEETVVLGADPKLACNWMQSDLAKLLNESGYSIAASKVTPTHIADLVNLVTAGTITGKTAKALLPEVFSSGVLPSQLVKDRGLVQVSDETIIRSHVQKALSENADAVLRFKNGQEAVAGFFVGLVMRATKGQAKPELVQKLIREELERSRGQ